MFALWMHLEIVFLHSLQMHRSRDFDTSRVFIQFVSCLFQRQVDTLMIESAIIWHFQSVYTFSQVLVKGIGGDRTCIFSNSQTNDCDKDGGMSLLEHASNFVIFWFFFWKYLSFNIIFFLKWSFYSKFNAYYIISYIIRLFIYIEWTFYSWIYWRYSTMCAVFFCFLSYISHLCRNIISKYFAEKVTFLKNWEQYLSDGIGFISVRPRKVILQWK